MPWYSYALIVWVLLNLAVAAGYWKADRPWLAEMTEGMIFVGFIQRAVYTLIIMAGYVTVPVGLWLLWGYWLLCTAEEAAAIGERNLKVDALGFARTVLSSGAVIALVATGTYS